MKKLNKDDGFVTTKEVVIGDKVMSRSTSRTGKIVGTHADGVTVDVQWDGGGLQAISSAGLYRLNKKTVDFSQTENFSRFQDNEEPYKNFYDRSQTFRGHEGVRLNDKNYSNSAKLASHLTFAGIDSVVLNSKALSISAIDFDIRKLKSAADSSESAIDVYANGNDSYIVLVAAYEDVLDLAMGIGSDFEESESYKDTKSEIGNIDYSKVDFTEEGDYSKIMDTEDSSEIG
jgi:hypothetical protein